MSVSRNFQANLSQLEADLTTNKFISIGRLSGIVELYNPYAEKQNNTGLSDSNRINAILEAKRLSSSQEETIKALQSRIAEKKDGLPIKENFQKLSDLIQKGKINEAEDLAEKLIVNLDRKLMRQKKQSTDSHQQLSAALKKIRAARPQNHKAELLSARLMAKFNDNENAERFYIKAMNKAGKPKLRQEIKKEHSAFVGSIRAQLKSQKEQKVVRQGRVKTMRPSQWRIKTPIDSSVSVTSQGMFADRSKPLPDKNFSVRLSPQVRNKH